MRIQTIRYFVFAISILLYSCEKAEVSQENTTEKPNDEKTENSTGITISINQEGEMDSTCYMVDSMNTYVLVVSADSVIHNPTDTIAPIQPEGVRNGSEDYPFLACDISTGSLGLYLRDNNMERSNSWVEGYIVGYINGTAVSKSVFDAGEKETNIIIADNADEADFNKVVPVQLSTGNTYIDTRMALNLHAHPENLHRRVKVKGKICQYMSTLGIKNTGKYKFLEE